MPRPLSAERTTARASEVAVAVEEEEFTEEIAF
jgi:hypothetical protein